ncbi:MAG TPA: hypothetical protein VJ044_05260, partial [Candidatus Hodarchaeales archaeon]|nr:hypothetical protein [Candidatus Hodarchaeales archaeon]
MKIINILAIGSPGCGKTHNLVKLANVYLKDANSRLYSIENLPTGLLSVYPIEFPGSGAKAPSFRIFELLDPILTFRSLKALEQMGTPIQGLLLFIDGLGFSLSLELLRSNLQLLSQVQKLEELAIGIFCTKSDV